MATLVVGVPKEIKDNENRVAMQPDGAFELAPTVPMKRTGSPEEIAGAILWLLSAEASYTTMALLDVTGGR